MALCTCLLSLMKDQAEAQKASHGIEGDVSLACVLGCVRFFAILRTVAHQDPLHWWVDSLPLSHRSTWKTRRHQIPPRGGSTHLTNGSSTLH